MKSKRAPLAKEESTLQKQPVKNWAEEAEGVLSCYDRIIITGTLLPLGYAHGMTGYLYQHGIRIFDYAKFAEPLRERVRANAEALAQANGVEIEFIRSKDVRKENRVQKVLKKRGAQVGLVHILGAMEACPSYRPWHNKVSGKTYLQADSSKCMTYYFYLMDEQLGLCYLRVPTWCPFRLQFYCNGHNWLAGQLKKRRIAYESIDNAFIHIADYSVANQLANELNGKNLQRRLDQLARQYCPVAADLKLNYHWSILQAEYATDLVFKSREALQVSPRRHGDAFYPHLLETLTHVVKPTDIATFLGRKWSGNYQGEMGNRLNTPALAGGARERWLGTRIKHQMGPVSIKMYDKFGFILRIETTAPALHRTQCGASVNNVSFFQHYRKVEHRDGSTTTRWAPMKKTIHSLPALREVLAAANQRYLKFIASLSTPQVGVQKLHKLAETLIENQHNHKGFNLFSEEDTCLFRTLLQGEFLISGFTNQQLRSHYLSHKSASQVTRLLKRLRVHGLIKKVGKRYKYYLTDFGRETASMALKLREMVVIPTLAYPTRALS